MPWPNRHLDDSTDGRSGSIAADMSGAGDHSNGRSASKADPIPYLLADLFNSLQSGRASAPT
jgi:hypothetical protein